jgi:hypothetical protein
VFLQSRPQPRKPQSLTKKLRRNSENVRRSNPKRKRRLLSQKRKRKRTRRTRKPRKTRKPRIPRKTTLILTERPLPAVSFAGHTSAYNPNEALTLE